MSTERQIIPYNSVSLMKVNLSATMVAICKGIRLYMEVEVIDEDPSSQQNEESFQYRFLDFLRRMDEDLQATVDLEDLIMQACLPHVEHMLLEDTHCGHETLYDYFNLPSAYIHLKIKAGYVEPSTSRTQSQEAEMKHPMPRVSLDQDTLACISRQQLRCVGASQLQVLRDPDVFDWDRYAMPHVVKTPASESPLFFKEIVDEESFVRELRTLMRIHDIDPSHTLKTPRLIGLVTWENDGSSHDAPSFIGLLMEHIAEARSLPDCIADGASAAERKEWMRQVVETVIGLHEFNITWGNAVYENVVVDADGQAFIVDFGARFCDDQVSREKVGTREGDLEDLNRLAQWLDLEWLDYAPDKNSQEMTQTSSSTDGGGEGRQSGGLPAHV